MLGSHKYIFTGVFEKHTKHSATEFYDNLFPIYKETNSERKCFFTKNGIVYTPKKKQIDKSF